MIENIQVFQGLFFDIVCRQDPFSLTLPSSRHITNAELLIVMQSIFFPHRIYGRLDFVNKEEMLML